MDRILITKTKTDSSMLTNQLNACISLASGGGKEIEKNGNEENWFQNQRKRKHSPLLVSSNTKCGIRYSSEVYVEQFEKYLEKFENDQDRYDILNELDKRGLHDELRTLNMRGQYTINKKLVELIMTKDNRTSKNLEYNWQTIEEAIIKVENIFLERSKKLDRKLRKVSPRV